jgi:hypothetical protein
MPGAMSSSIARNDTCVPARYTTELLSLDPLIIYINDFLTLPEIEAILALGYARSYLFLGLEDFIERVADGFYPT